jgi:hypothetical protein
LTRQLVFRLLLMVIFLAIFVIAIFFLQDAVTRILLGIAATCGVVASFLNLVRVSEKVRM